MADITVASYEIVSLGNRIGITAKTAAIANTNTWSPGLSTIDSVQLLNGASGETLGATISGGTITFAASGSLANCMILAVGT